ncbi:MAG: HPr family phosphocarrier protein [Lachnospiraceae bacterium]|nr:HPr family phosphocarrier protein [Lachnospiraceae bacterium]
MTSQEVIANLPDDLDMSHAVEMAEYAVRYKSTCYIIYQNKQVSAKSLLGILSLCIKGEAKLRVMCEGEDEEEAVRGISGYLANMR